MPANCPECRVPLNGRSRCQCGWGESADEAAPRFEICDYCRSDYRWYGHKERPAPGNRIVGRSKRGGHICLTCYEGRNEIEFDGMDARIERLYEEHRDDEVGSMLRAAHGKQSKEDRHDLVQWMKHIVRNFGKLPYDKTQRQDAA